MEGKKISVLGQTTMYLTAEELSELVGCKPNQRSRMTTWLTARGWKFEVNSSGLPRVARAHHDKKMGIIEGKIGSRYADTPNLNAFQ
jgi:hypothetical protein